MKFVLLSNANYGDGRGKITIVEQINYLKVMPATSRCVSFILSTGSLFKYRNTAFISPQKIFPTELVVILHFCLFLPTLFLGSFGNFVGTKPQE